MWYVDQLGHANFGRGTTPESAMQDALYWLDGPDGRQGSGWIEWLEGQIKTLSEARDGDLVLIQG